MAQRPMPPRADSGVPVQQRRFPWRLLIPAGAGEHDPIASNATAEGRQKNRRIEIALLPAINELPPLPKSLGENAEPAKK